MKIAIFILSLMPVASAAAETRPCDIYEAAETQLHVLQRILWPELSTTVTKVFYTQLKKQMGQHLT